MLGQMAVATALPGFNDLGRSVIPIFLLMDHFLYRFSTFSEKMKKIYRLEVWIFCKMHLRIPFFLALRLYAQKFQMPFDGLRFGSFPHASSLKGSWWPPIFFFFSFLSQVTHYLTAVKNFKKSIDWKVFIFYWLRSWSILAKLLHCLRPLSFSISLDLVSTNLYSFAARVHCYYCLYIIFFSQSCETFRRASWGKWKGKYWTVNIAKEQ